MIIVHEIEALIDELTIETGESPELVIVAQVGAPDGEQYVAKVVAGAAPLFDRRGDQCLYAKGGTMGEALKALNRLCAVRP